MTGTSSEYLGRRPLRRIVRERVLVFVLGPRGSGKTTVAQRVAAQGGGKVVTLDVAALQNELVHRTRTGRWATRVIDAPSLVLDGPMFLRTRPGVTEFLRQLIASRRDRGLRTVVCEAARDGSLPLLMEDHPAGTTATVGLRFPASRSGRMRFARRACDELRLPRKLARGTDALEPWGYEAVIAELRRVAAEAPPREPVAVGVAAAAPVASTAS